MGLLVYAPEIQGAAMLVMVVGAMAGEAEAAPATKIEQFEASYGSVLIKSFDEVGGAAGRFGSSVTVTAVRMVDAQTGIATSGVRFDVTQSETRKHSSYVDMDEIPSLVKGLAYIETFTPDGQPFPGWEVSYSTRGDLSVTVFNQPGRPEVMAAVTSGTIYEARAYLAASDIAFLRAHLETAQASLTAAAFGAK